MKGTEVEKRKQKNTNQHRNKNQFCTLEHFYISLILPRHKRVILSVMKFVDHEKRHASNFPYTNLFCQLHLNCLFYYPIAYKVCDVTFLEKLPGIWLLNHFLLIIFPCKVDYKPILLQLCPNQVDIADVDHH